MPPKTEAPNSPFSSPAILVSQHVSDDESEFLSPASCVSEASDDEEPNPKRHRVSEDSPKLTGSALMPATIRGSVGSVALSKSESIPKAASSSSSASAFTVSSSSSTFVPSYSKAAGSLLIRPKAAPRPQLRPWRREPTGEIFLPAAQVPSASEPPARPPARPAFPEPDFALRDFKPKDPVFYWNIRLKQWIGCLIKEVTLHPNGERTYHTDLGVVLTDPFIRTIFDDIDPNGPPEWRLPKKNHCLRHATEQPRYLRTRGRGIGGPD